DVCLPIDSSIEHHFIVGVALERTPQKIGQHWSNKAARPSKKTPTSATVIPVAWSCSGRITTASYSNNIGTLATASNCLLRRARRRVLEAPVRLRPVATASRQRKIEPSLRYW